MPDPLWWLTLRDDVSPDTRTRGACRVASFLHILFGFATSLYALSWVGMWMGLASGKPSQAATRTFVYVMVLPWFVMNVFQVPLMRMLGSGAFMMNFVFVMYFFFVTKDILFVIWAKKRFHQDLRVVASRSVSDQATELSWKRWLSRLRPMPSPK